MLSSLSITQGILYCVQFGCVHIVISSLITLFSKKECGSCKSEKKNVQKFTDYLEYLVASTNFDEKVVGTWKESREISRIFEELLSVFFLFFC